VEYRNTLLQGLVRFGPVTRGSARALLHRLARPPTSTDPLLLLAGLAHFGPSALAMTVFLLVFLVCRPVSLTP